MAELDAPEEYHSTQPIARESDERETGRAEKMTRESKFIADHKSTIGFFIIR